MLVIGKNQVAQTARTMELAETQNLLEAMAEKVLLVLLSLGMNQGASAVVSKLA
jgi:hypothetical protein